MFNREIKKQFKNSFLLDEQSLYCLSISRNKIPIYDIFEVEKIKKERLTKYRDNILKKLQLDFSFIQDILLHPLDNSSVMLSFKNGRSDRIFLTEEGKLKFLYCTQFLEFEQEFILKKYENEIKSLIKFGIETNYNNTIELKTVSRNYKLELTQTRFSVYRTYNFVKLIGPKLELHYFYSQTSPSNLINTDLGMFNVYTDIDRIYHILNETNNDDSHFRMKKLLQNLFVYENDVPEYLKEEIQKIKVLKNK